MNPNLSSRHIADPGTIQLLGRYAESMGAVPPTVGAPLLLTIDGIYRIRLRAVGQGIIVVSSRLCPLPEPGLARDQMLERLGTLACGTMQRSAATCVVDEQERAVWLQQTAHSISTQDIDDLVGEFVNELAFWVGVVRNV